MANGTPTTIRLYPCLDEMRRYTSFPCSKCTAPSCPFGKKPASAPTKGQKLCKGCRKPFKQQHNEQYHTESCRYLSMLDRRKAKRAGVTP